MAPSPPVPARSRPCRFRRAAKRRTVPRVTSEVWAALIAAAVSTLAGAGTVWVTHRSTSATLRRDAERQQAEFRRAMTERLYERRMATYPGLFDATSAFRRSKMRAAADLPLHLRATLDLVDDWQSKQGGLILSPNAHRCLRRLRDDVREAVAAEPLDDTRERPIREDLVAQERPAPRPAPGPRAAVPRRGRVADGRGPLAGTAGARSVRRMEGTLR